MWMTFIPMAFLGISLEVFLAASYTQIIWAFCIHTKFLKKTPGADRIFNTPSLHRVHHARNRQYIDKNYGGILSIWDQLFGTYQKELDDVPAVYGVRESLPSYSPLIINSYYLKTIWKKLRLPAILLKSLPLSLVRRAGYRKKLIKTIFTVVKPMFHQKTLCQMTR